MSFCPNCGTKLNDGVKFCTECGTRVSAQVPVDPVPPVCIPPAEPEQSYEPPVQQSYEPPVQQSYEPPVQQSYESPVQQSYTPPVQTASSGSYTPPPAPPKAEKPARAPKEPKNLKVPQIGGMKKLPIIIGAAVLVILLIVLLVSCGGKNQGDQDDWGVYEGISCVVSGTELVPEGEWIELQKKGKAKLCIMGDEFSGKWTLDGTAFHVNGGGIECDGTLENGVMSIDYDGVVFNLVNEAYAAPAAQAPAPALQ